MGYYIRILSQSSEPVALDDVRAAVAETGLGASVQDVVEADGALKSFEIVKQNGDSVLAFERNPVENGSMGAEEIAEFLEEIADARPTSAAQWLANYLPRVKTVYAVQLFADDSYGAVIDAVLSVPRRAGSSIIQADLEGFSNEHGDHILWQFSDRVTGPWWMAVLDAAGRWQRFQMDLGDPEHRKAFRAGKVPPGLTATSE